MRRSTFSGLTACIATLCLGACLAPSLLASTSYTREGPVEPGPDDGNIAEATVRLLEQEHFKSETRGYPDPIQFDDTASSNFFHKYLTALDPQRLYFLQSDIEQFSEFETTLDDWTADKNAGPGFDIFERFFQRMEQRTAFVHELLETEPFVFEDTDPILLNRRDADFPADLDEARHLWRERLRYEFLEEKLRMTEERAEAEAEAEKEQDQSGGVSTNSIAATNEPPKTVDEEIRDTLDRRYARQLKYLAEWDNDDVLEIYLTTLGHVFDPHTDYMGRAELEQFAISINQSLFGIGAQLRATDGYCTIERLLAGGPAAKSNKLKEKERIIAVAQEDGEPVDVVDMHLHKVVQLIRGPKGSKVHLTVIQPENEPTAERKIVTLIRDEIPLYEQAAKAQLIETPGDHDTPHRIGVIDLPNFYAPMAIESGRGVRHARFSTSEDVLQYIERLKKEGVEGIILDLRLNGGGSLEEAIRLAGLFIERGPIVQVSGPDGIVDIRRDRDPDVAYDGPLLVLTSRGSASASEIVAGALQDYERAIVVGDVSTHGKGTVQSLTQLAPYLWRVMKDMTESPGALKITVQKFYRANGASTQLRGITPDIILPSVANVIEDIGESSLDNPLEWDEIKPSKFVRLNQVAPYLPELRKLSEARVSLSTDFGYIQEDMERLQERQNRKTILLNEAERIEEREEAKARTDARKAERDSRPASGEVVYEFTLRNVGEAGLPEPGLTQDDEEDEDSEDPRIDPTLDEAKSILLDYIRLMNESKVLTADKASPPMTEDR